MTIITVHKTIKKTGTRISDEDDTRASIFGLINR